MALQLLKRNYTMQGMEIPRILKLPQGEMRWSPRRLPVDIGDVLMQVRMEGGENKYIAEHVSKYAQGLNPYGEYGYPYKVNKNNIRPPIIDPKFYAALSRMPVKFDRVTSGPIVSELYKKSAAIEKVAPRTIIDRVCPEVESKVSSSSRSINNNPNSFQEGEIMLHLKQPRPSIPYWPSMPYLGQPSVPEIELDPKIIARPNMGIHAPFPHSDQSRNILNMRTPQHVAVAPGYKDPYTSVYVQPETITGVEEDPNNTSVQSNLVAPIPTFDNLTRDGYDFAPKVQTSAWYNPSYYLTELSGYSIGNIPQNCLNDDPIHTNATAQPGYRMINNGQKDVPINTKEGLQVSQMSNVNSFKQYGQVGIGQLHDTVPRGQFDAKATVPVIEEHQTFNRIRQSTPQQYHFVENMGQYGDPLLRQGNGNVGQSRAGIRERLQLQKPKVDLTWIGAAGKGDSSRHRTFCYPNVLIIFNLKISN